MNYPEDYRYTESHEWIHLQDGKAKVGITDHAQNELSDVVFVECPETGVTVAPGEAIAVVESVKAASDIYAPVPGKVTAANEQLADNPGLVNSDPHGEGWIFEIQVDDESVLDDLLTASAYQKFLKK
jgi:glycine cleavage system H protein